MLFVDRMTIACFLKAAGMGTEMSQKNSLGFSLLRHKLKSLHRYSWGKWNMDKRIDGTVWHVL